MKSGVEERNEPLDLKSEFEQIQRLGKWREQSALNKLASKYPDKNVEKEYKEFLGQKFREKEAASERAVFAPLFSQTRMQHSRLLVSQMAQSDTDSFESAASSSSNTASPQPSRSSSDDRVTNSPAFDSIDDFLGSENVERLRKMQMKK